MIEQCRFFGPLLECNFGSQASFEDHLRKIFRNPLNIGGKPSVCGETIIISDGVDRHWFYCRSKYSESLEGQTEIQKTCDAYVRHS